MKRSEPSKPIVIDDSSENHIYFIKRCLNCSDDDSITSIDDICNYISQKGLKDIEKMYTKLIFKGVSELRSYTDSGETAKNILEDFLKVLNELNRAMAVNQRIYVVADLGDVSIGTDENAQKWMDYVAKVIYTRAPHGTFTKGRTAYRCFTKNSKLRFIMYTKAKKASEVIPQLNEMAFKMFSIRAYPYCASVANVIMPMRCRGIKECKKDVVRHLMEGCDVDVFSAVADDREGNAVVSLIINNEEFKKIKSNDRYQLVTMSRFQTFKTPRDEWYKLFFDKGNDKKYVWVTNSKKTINCLLHSQVSSSYYKEKIKEFKE